MHVPPIFMTIRTSFKRKHSLIERMDRDPHYRNVQIAKKKQSMGLGRNRSGGSDSMLEEIIEEQKRNGVHGLGLRLRTVFQK